MNSPFLSEIWTPFTMETRRHQLKRQVELENAATWFEQLSTQLTDPEARLNALQLSVEMSARANRLRNVVAASNFMVPESADQEARRLEREREQ